MGFQPVNLFMYFTNISFILNCFLIHPFLSAVLYLCNISAFLGTLLLLTINPLFPYVEFKDVFPAPLWLFNFILIAVHFIPLYLFRERQTLEETFSPAVIAGAGFAFFLYYAVFKHKLQQFYGLPAETQGKLSLCLFLLFWGVYIILYYK